MSDFGATFTGVEIFFEEGKNIAQCKYWLKKRGLVWASWAWEESDGVLESEGWMEDTGIWFLDFKSRYVFKFTNPPKSSGVDLV